MWRRPRWRNSIIWLVPVRIAEETAMDVITVDQIAPFTSMRWIPEGNVTALHSFSLLSA